MTDTDRQYSDSAWPTDDRSLGKGNSQEERIHVADGSEEHVDTGLAELTAMRTAYEALAVLEESPRRRAVEWLIDSLGLRDLRTGMSVSQGAVTAEHSEDAQGRTIDVPNPREFMSGKKPQSHVERIACLAYYLARYRDVQHFKTPDISDINIEAAGQKFGNLSRDIDNADRSSGYIVTAVKGAKQLTPRGEAIVDALPDREAVKLALRDHPYRARRSSGSGKKASPSEEGDR
jgi:hypothetical protein